MIHILLPGLMEQISISPRVRALPVCTCALTVTLSMRLLFVGSLSSVARCEEEA